MDWRYNTIWTERLPEACFKSINFSDRLQAGQNFNGIRYVRSIRFKSAFLDLTDFPADENTLYLELLRSNIESFSGLSRFSKLKRLEVHDCMKLTNGRGLSGVKDSLEWLHINQSKKFEIDDELLSLSKLRVLCLNVCAPLRDLGFLSAFPHLVDFRFVDTNVLDGDLTPLFSHPSLVTVGFLNKRHYNVKEKQADDFFQRKKPLVIEKTFKGPYETYRYTTFGTD